MSHAHTHINIHTHTYTHTTHIHTHTQTHIYTHHTYTPHTYIHTHTDTYTTHTLNFRRFGGTQKQNGRRIFNPRWLDTKHLYLFDAQTWHRRSIPSHRYGSLLGLKVNHTSLETSTRVAHFLLRILYWVATWRLADESCEAFAFTRNTARLGNF